MDQDRRNAWGFSLFADDLRSEAGGKVSLMGIYQDDMIFLGVSFPIVLPRFVVLISYFEIPDSIKSDVTFKVSYIEEANVIAHTLVHRKDIQIKSPPEPSNEDKPERIFHARVPLIMSPFPIEQAGPVRVRAHYSDGAILKLGALGIKSITIEEWKAQQDKLVEAVQKMEAS